MRKQPAILPIPKYEEMWRAFRDEQTIEYVSKTCRVAYNTAKKYIQRGDPKRGLPPIQDRYADYRDGYMESDKLNSEDQIAQHGKETRALRIASFSSQFDRETGQMTDEAKQHATPKNFIALSEYELKLASVGRTRLERQAELKEALYKVDWREPKMKEIFMRYVRGYTLKNMSAVARDLLMALDPDGKAGLRDRLPQHLREILDMQPDDLEPEREMLREVEATAPVEGKVVEAEVS